MYNRQFIHFGSAEPSSMIDDVLSSKDPVISSLTYSPHVLRFTGNVLK